MSISVKNKMKKFREELNSSKKEEQNYMKVKFNYVEIILPYLQGMKLVESLRYAEEYNTSNWDDPKILPLTKDKIDINIVSKKDYELFKMSALLNISYKLLKEYDEMTDEEEKIKEDEINEGSD